MTGFKHIVKDLWLAVLLILVTSSVLLLSDRQQRLGPARMDTKEYPDIAIMQINSTTLLDAHVAGVISRLRERGYYAPDGRNIRRFNPQRELALFNRYNRLLNLPERSIRDYGAWVWCGIRASSVRKPAWRKLTLFAVNWE